MPVKATLDRKDIIKVEELKIPQSDARDPRKDSKSPNIKYKDQVDFENERLIESVSKVTDLLRAN